ncbi:MAG: DUF401 family protein [Bacillota bacterium]
MPWYIALSGSIIIILFSIYTKLNIGLTMLAGAATLGLLAGLPLTGFLNVLTAGLWNNITIMLMISILLLGVLGHILRETGSIGEIILNLNALVSDIRIIAATMPMLIGMLTVPGGAILSAPLCAEAGTRLEVSPVRQAVINNWFRHVLYFIFPLFPSLIIASELSGVSLGLFFLHNLPLTLIGTIFGFFFLFKGYSGLKEEHSISFSWRRTGLLIKSILPLIIILILVVGFDLYFPFALMAGITLAIFNYLPRSNKSSELIQRLRTMLLPGLKIQVALVIAGIMLYKEMLAQTGVILDMTNLVLELGLPVILLIAVISFLVGMLTGDNSASVVILFPLFMPLIPVGGAVYTAYLAYIYAGSTAGHIISPAHPCFSLTKEYYSIEIKEFILLTLPMLAVVMATGFLITALFGFY